MQNISLPQFHLNFEKLLSAFCAYLRQVHYVPMPPNRIWNCRLANTAMSSSLLWSTLFILSMTFERFYGIVRPHKAASFNTVKRAKIIIGLCVIFGFFYNTPGYYFSQDFGLSCYYRTPNPYWNIYSWLTFVINVILPFILLITMNAFIIHTLKTRSSKQLTKLVRQGQGRKRGHNAGLKTTEKQIYVTLLLVTFGFLILTTPGNLFHIYSLVVGWGDTPGSIARSHLFFQIAHKTLYTNSGINFFFYVISGHKFRTDLLKLFRCDRDKRNEKSANVSKETNLSFVAQATKAVNKERDDRKETSNPVTSLD